MGAELDQMRQISTSLIKASDARLQALKTGRAVDWGDEQLIQQRLRLAQSIVDSAPQALSIARDIFFSAVETYRAAKELDVALEQYQIARQSSIARLRIVAPIVEKQLDRIANQVDRIMAEVTALNPRSCTSEDLAHRTALLQCGRDMSQQLAQVLLSLIRA